MNHRSALDLLPWAVSRLPTEALRRYVGLYEADPRVIEREMCGSCALGTMFGGTAGYVEAHRRAARATTFTGLAASRREVRRWLAGGEERPHPVYVVEYAFEEVPDGSRAAIYDACVSELARRSPESDPTSGTTPAMAATPATAGSPRGS